MPKTKNAPAKSLEEIKRILSEQRETLKREYNVKTIGVFGSYVRGKQKKKSDIDILVEYSVSPDFFEYLDLEEYLSGLVNTKVDLVMKDALKPYIGKHILEEVVYI